MSQADVLVTVHDLRKYFPVRRGVLKRVVGQVQAVDGVSFDIQRGETLGLVGESGCGKSTTGRTILQLLQPTAGRVTFDGQLLNGLNSADLRPLRRRMQIIFQDPYSSLNPRMTVGRILAEPMEIHNLGERAGRQARIRELLEMVGLDPAFVNRYPHQFSGGQRQRIGIARALATNPEFIVADEPISALDVSIQAQIVNLMEDLKQRLGLTYLFIAHDLSMVRHMSDRVAVMYLGRIVEMGLRDALYDNPLHPYTQALISAIPIPDPVQEAKRQPIILEGDVPNPANPPAGCRFHPRCRFATDICRQDDPPLRHVGPADAAHQVACHHAEKFLLPARPASQAHFSGAPL